VLRKELDALRNDLSKAEEITKAAKKKCDGEWEAQSKLQEQFRAADAVRQEAFVHLQDLKKQQREKVPKEHLKVDITYKCLHLRFLLNPSLLLFFRIAEQIFLQVQR